MPIVSREHVAAQRQHLLDAALRCFARNGIHPTTMQQLSREARVSIGTVYHYFPSKRALLKGVLRTSLAENLDWAEAAAARPDPSEAMRAVLDAAFGMLDDPESAQSMRFGVLAHGEAMRDKNIAAAYADLYDQMEKRFCPMIERIQREGAIRADLEPGALLRLVTAVIEGVRVQRLVDPKLDLRRVSSTLAQLLIEVPSGGRPPRRSRRR